MAKKNRRKKNTNVRRDYKARLFEMIFREKEELLGLYNAVNGTNYSNPDELEINTLENAIYLSMHNDDIVNACKTLNDYVIYSSRVRQYAEKMEIENAVEQAITECIAEGILTDFLTRYRNEAKKMSIYEYEEEQQRRWDKEEGEEIGLAKGIEKGLAKGENRFATLASALIEAGRAEDVLKATKDMEYREKLYKEYGIH